MSKEVIFPGIYAVSSPSADHLNQSMRGSGRDCTSGAESSGGRGVKPKFTEGKWEQMSASTAGVVSVHDSVCVAAVSLSVR